MKLKYEKGAVDGEFKNENENAMYRKVKREEECVRTKGRQNMHGVRNGV